ncbi:hypothetical protein KUTeg_018749 [Tegillarca granosa]|uniref:C1q domain-containing protein n=1 Tax=Tegillarca granosa TaxID=220873 RepID=A0ABQ9EEG7_TEGGR|nr:hypothetical protein KUTeg_018749 [Tegillarca granosa]
MCHYGTFNELRLMMNGSSKMLIYTGNNELHNQGTNSVVLQLKKSDTVWIETSGYPSQSNPNRGLLFVIKFHYQGNSESSALMFRSLLPESLIVVSISISRYK